VKADEGTLEAASIVAQATAAIAPLVTMRETMSFLRCGSPTTYLRERLNRQ
jgi:hypothetical protein